MREKRILLYILIYAMLIGGIMGIIKELIPNMEWLGFRYLLGLGGTFNGNSIPAYAIIYGIFMALLEITSSILLLAKKRSGMKFSIITLSINALVCIIAIIIGDILAIGSLIIRIFAICILIKLRTFYFKLVKDEKIIRS